VMLQGTEEAQRSEFRRAAFISGSITFEVSIMTQDHTLQLNSFFFYP